MIKIADYTIHNIYQGGFSSLDPNTSYGSIFTGYHVPAGQLGAPTKADTANQIQQVNMLLNQGIVPIEVGVMNPQIFDQIPKQHFKEINRMMQLTGGKVSVHAPIIEASGVSDQGWTESNRQLAEKQLFDVIERTRELDPTGGMPITIHSTGLPGVEYEMTADGKKIQKLAVIERETGKIHGLETEERYYPGMEPEEFKTGRVLTPEKRMKIMNATSWDNSIDQVFFNKERADEILSQNEMQVEHLFQDPKVRKAFAEENLGSVTLSDTQLDTLKHLQVVHGYLDDVNQNISLLFSKAYKYGSEEQREKLKELNEQYCKDLKERAKESINKVSAESKAMQNFLIALKSPEFAPEIYVPVEQFALEQASKTFSNVALKNYEKFGDKAPVLSIENMFAGMAFGLKPEDKEGKGIPGMNELILETKHRFIENAIKSKDQGGLGLSKSSAESQADKMIGMTLDVGHLNIAKKLGFKDEDLAKEVAAIAKHVKHVHLTDNFGYSDSHLPPGMGNVPFKKILEELEKAGTLGKSRKIVEAPGWPQHFGSSPLLYTLAGMGSELTQGAGGPRWDQTEALQQGYYGGMGMALPQINYQTFGAGFSKLPTELGGQMAGAQGSRLGGTPME